MDLQRRLSLLVTSPRVAPGMLSHQAWQALDAADVIYARGPDQPGAAASVTAAGYEVARMGEGPVRDVARRLVHQAGSGMVIWLGSTDADPGLTEALAAELTAHPDPPELEMLVGSWDLPGSRLLDAVTVMDRLRAPGGCPWDAEQTHASLVPYLVEETYECVEALESGDREHIVEELGDVLLQVLFHARVAQESQDGYAIDDVAAALVEKLIRRHPHVFAGETAETAAQVQATWSQLKEAEKPERSHPLDGIPAAMPDLARAVKAVSRLERAGHGSWLEEQVAAARESGPSGSIAAALLEVVRQARATGIDPGVALRETLRSIESGSRGRQEPAPRP
ncbi:MAG: MazG family protein [Ornithinimicrobium sp.]